MAEGMAYSGTREGLSCLEQSVATSGSLEKDWVRAMGKKSEEIPTS